MFGRSHLDRAVRALTERKPTPWGWRPMFGTRFAHNAVASLLLFLIAFLFMGIPVFASAGGPPVARHVTVIQRNIHKGGSGITPVKRVITNTEGDSGITPIKMAARPESIRSSPRMASRFSCRFICPSSPGWVCPMDGVRAPVASVM